MFIEVQYKDIDTNKIHGSYILIDLRSPGEFESETIPGSVNIPIFNNEERKVVGTTYIQESIETAKKLGLDIASKKLPQIYEKVSTLDKQYDNLIFFCAKGGFRSNSISSLFRSIGINAIKLEGGYKAYRRYINENLPILFDKVKFVVLYGNTGSGKTEILYHLENMEIDVLNLEKCANHRGSLLGSVGLNTPNSQKMFESLVFETLSNRKSNIIFTEGESKRIGRIVMPEYMFNKIKSGTNISINTNMETRIDNILKDYLSNTNNEELIKALSLLRRHLGDRNIDNYIEMINNKEYKTVAKELMEKYYDPMYEFKNRIYVKTFGNESSKETAEKIMQLFIPQHRE
ncbi:MAG: tRNA 2-selenouridine(34) synthase MnmH [Tissierellia bacterium]|nr:tRNA 2-selenouridine(34) synthase MnmH [Tissierellia bacterium]MDD4726060.1 tRNA 2-selenouridine(34) synthase MnmH [Tissierellia bacterium]